MESERSIKLVIAIRYVNNRTGLELLAAFKELGSYHFTFWNCQLFAKLFLKLICKDSHAVDFDALTSAEVARMVRRHVR